MARSKRSFSSSCIPRASISPTEAVLSRIRITTPSPWTSGSVTTRMSTRRPSTVKPKRPSWGTRRSEMSRSAMILMRETTEADIFRLTVAAGVSTPSTRYMTRVSPSSGLMWMSEAPCWVACATIECTSLITGRLVFGLGQAEVLRADLLLLVDDVFDRIVQLGELGQQQVEVLDRGGAGAHAAAGHHADVVDRQDVGGIGHRHQHAAVLGEADRHRLVAAGGGGADEVDGAHVEVEGGQVDEVQAEALGHHAGELVVAQDPAFDQDQAGRAALLASRLDSVLDGLAVRQPEVHDDLSDHARGTTRMTGRVEALVRVGRWRGRGKRARLLFGRPCSGYGGGRGGLGHPSSYRHFGDGS